MAQRHLDVLHVLAAREGGGTRQFLFYPHPKWSAPDSREPFLALPTKKIVRGPHSASPGGSTLRRTLAAVLREDLGVAIESARWERRLPRTALEMRSPTRGTPTTYTIWPVLVTVDASQHDVLRARLRGEWLTEEEARRHPLLSPTAGRVLEGVDVLSPERVAADEWSARLAAVCAGDVNALGPLFEDMRPWLTARLAACPLTRALFQVPDEVEDALQDAVVMVLTHPGSFDPRLGSAATWVWFLTRNAAVARLRGRGRRAAESLFHDDGRPRDELADDTADPAALAEAEEELGIARRHLRRALAQSGRASRRAWKLRYDHGKSYAEIAAVTGEPVGTVATRIHRVKQAAQRLAAGEGRGAEPER
jgi:RNA polymerase sigma-70 factor (ECF subfamily)